MGASQVVVQSIGPLSLRQGLQRRQPRSQGTCLVAFAWYSRIAAWLVAGMASSPPMPIGIAPNVSQPWAP